MNLDKVIAVRTSKTVYRDGDKAIKMFDSNFAKSDILNEALNQARIEETGLNVPKMQEVTKINDKWAIVSDYISGKTMQRLMDENPDKIQYYLEQLVELQISIHSKTSPLLTTLKDKMKRKISQSTLNASIRYELSTRLESMPDHNKVCHGDFNPSNVIVADDGKMYVIDWSHATQGNASADVARTYLLFWLDGKIEQAEQYLKIFCEKSDTAVQYIKRWLPIVASSQSVKGKESEKEFLMHWIDVVEFQ